MYEGNPLRRQKSRLLVLALGVAIGIAGCGGGDPGPTQRDLADHWLGQHPALVRSNCSYLRQHASGISSQLERMDIVRRAARPFAPANISSEAFAAAVLARCR